MWQQIKQNIVLRRNDAVCFCIPNSLRLVHLTFRDCSWGRPADPPQSIPTSQVFSNNIIFSNTFAQSDYTSVMHFTKNFREILNIIQVVFRSFSRSLAIYCPILHRLLCLYPAVNKVQLLEILHENLPYKINLQKSVSVNWCFGICYLCKLC